ncbi:MAG: hypothetical protein II949_13040 [Prevotella sp.]|nr:hypothetical protein [Prevotella sp.]
MENLTLRFEDVPRGWALCFNNECPLRSECLRHQAGTLIPDTMTIAVSVTEKALADGQCQHFAPAETATFARGFTHLYDHVRQADYTALRKAMTAYLHGKRIYYEYKRGERLLSPAEQQWIARLFARYGYEDAPVFDGYEQHYVFAKP